MGKGGVSKGMGSSLGGGFKKVFTKSSAPEHKPAGFKPSKQAQIHQKPVFEQHKPKMENHDGGMKPENRPSNASVERNFDQPVQEETGTQPGRRGCCLTGCALPMAGLAAIAFALIVKIAG